MEVNVTAYTVYMKDDLGNTDTVEVEVSEVSEMAACREAEFVVKTQPMCAWIETTWHAVRADRAPGAWMWAT